MGTVKAVCTSDVKGIQKTATASVNLKPDWGIEDDAHAGKWHRQVSLLGYEQIEAFKALGADVADCIMPREGVFCRVLEGGRVAPGDAVDLVASEG